MAKRILLIDRDAIRRAQLRASLTREGFLVTDFASGKEALQPLLFSPVNAVVADFGSSFEPSNPLPEGKRLISEIIEVDAFVPLVLTCDRCDTLDHKTAAATDLVLRRPFTERQFFQAIETVLGETLRERAQRKSGYIFAFR